MKKTNLLKWCKVFASILLTGICLQANAQENKPAQAKPTPSDQKSKTDAQLEYEAKMKANGMDLDNPRAHKYKAANNVANNAPQVKEVKPQPEQKPAYAAESKTATNATEATSASVINTNKTDGAKLEQKQKLTVEQYTAQFNTKLNAITAKAQSYEAAKTHVMNLFEGELESASAYFSNEQIETIIENFKNSMNVEMQKLQDKLVNSNN
jgi:hypothetical protein